MSAAASTPELTSGRLFILFLAQLRAEGHHAASTWSSHKADGEWDGTVDKAMNGALASQTARHERAEVDAPTLAYRHVKGGVSEVTAAASQVLGKGAGINALLCYVGGPDQADDINTLGAALGPAVTGDARLTVFVGQWKANLGHHRQWEKVWQAFELVGPDAAADEEDHVVHPVLDRLAPQLAALPTGA